MMRIITGSARGYRLCTLPGEDVTRPTTERVKQSIFNALQFEIEGRAVLDLFAGSGQMGLEALSRGADHATFVDCDKNACEVVKKNAAGAKLRSLTVRNMTAEAFLASVNDMFDIAFLDPPYRARLLPKVLPLLCRHIRKGGTVVCETDKETALPDTVSCETATLTLEKQRAYGKTVVWFYRCDSID